MSLSTLLYSILQDVLRIGGPILIIIGSIGSILNVIVFAKGSLRKSSCTICLITVNIINFLYFYLGLLIATLAGGYNIDPSSTNISFCRFRYYIAWVLSSWQSSCLILASIDRTLTTSSSARIRKYSTRRLIAICLFCIHLFWILFHIHALIFVEILEVGPNYFVCFFQAGTYTTFMTYCALIINGSLPPLLMAIFGFWTVKNIRRVQRASHLFKSTNTQNIVCGRPFSVHSKDRQLIRILLIDIIAFIICKCPITIFAIYLQITKDNIKMIEQQITELSILLLTFVLYFIENSIGCYINMLVSKTFRTELKRTLSNIFYSCFHLTN